MFNKLQPFVQRLNRSVEYARLLYRDFRIYDVGSYALNRLTPRKGYSVQENVAYGLRARHRLDLFRTQTPREHRPLIVFVHGGAWMHGDKKDYRFIGEAFAKEGFDVAVINYHLAPEHIFPASIDDLSLALNYLNVHQLKYQISTEKVVLMGHSAGAFNVMSALYHPKPYEIQCRSQITAIIGLAGPYHFDYKGDPICADAFDQNRPYQEVMPYYFVESNTVKHYLLVAENDDVVGLSNAVDLDRRLKEKGNYSQLWTVPRIGHISMIGSVSSLFSRYFTTKQKIMQALEDALKH
ncbi:alpha/beta hydrolase [Acinetobacter sp. MYb177]|jgi:acetyl esterase/lipase|uniref:Alpha/beta hydrolase n=1 Tax=Acinetobacter johnsonii TaxID=40214 RepID=A0A5C0U8S2_ACIJO|nr:MULTISPECIES: alpha/beta hydrolase [Acinetobacter]MDA1172312.1 alpha/beta hydrolase [Pseudomonadota bacterium]MDH0825819.1 alpha/beta hydrolase [Acinetobacter johnsonii]MDH0969781.1 alpha/beta hydrolase [Acinetobacter johnsonii]MDH1517676.1 alpha/beta hydrolase [Acinetobacter johnsonii]MDH1698558.1 alpha/beta hydrolase [Acinetobacter johnsonii]